MLDFYKKFDERHISAKTPDLMLKLRYSYLYGFVRGTAEIQNVIEGEAKAYDKNDRKNDFYYDSSKLRSRYKYVLIPCMFYDFLFSFETTYIFGKIKDPSFIYAEYIKLREEWLSEIGGALALGMAGMATYLFPAKYPINLEFNIEEMGRDLYAYIAAAMGMIDGSEYAMEYISKEIGGDKLNISEIRRIIRKLKSDIFPNVANTYAESIDEYSPKCDREYNHDIDCVKIYKSTRNSPRYGEYLQEGVAVYVRDTDISVNI